MTRTITTLPIEDVYPNEKNYREVTDEGVAEIAASIEDAGQRTPIEVWQDGDIYWVVDGNHRLLAMKNLGKTDIAAVVVPHPSDAEYVVNSVASNVAIPVTALDKSHGAQMMFATGVPPKSIAAQLGISEERATKAKRGYAIAKDYAEDMGIERLEALNDFDGDEEACQRIMTAPEASWKNVVAQINADKTIEANRLHAMAILEAASCELITAPDNGTMQYLTSASSIGSDPVAPEGAKWATYNQHNGWIAWYGDISEAVETPEQAKAREEADRLRLALTAASEKRMAFVLAHLTNEGPITSSNALRDLAVSSWEDGVVADVSDIAEALAEVHGFAPRIYAAVLSVIESDACNGLSGRSWYGIDEDKATAVVYLDALVAVGYELSDIEASRLTDIRAALTPSDSADSITEEEGADDE